MPPDIIQQFASESARERELSQEKEERKSQEKLSNIFL